jgi:hypothetical protein
MTVARSGRLERAWKRHGRQSAHRWVSLLGGDQKGATNTGTTGRAGALYHRSIRDHCHHASRLACLYSFDVLNNKMLELAAALFVSSRPIGQYKNRLRERAVIPMDYDRAPSDHPPPRCYTTVPLTCSYQRETRTSRTYLDTTIASSSNFSRYLCFFSLFSLLDPLPIPFHSQYGIVTSFKPSSARNCRCFKTVFPFGDCD